MTQMEDYVAAFSAFATTQGADLLAYCGNIDSKGEKQVRDALAGRATKNQTVYLILATLGGSPDSAYRMARAIRRAYPKGLKVAVAWYCKSAGTLLAIGADEIVMSDSAELGPLDIQIQKPDEIFELTSGLTAYKAIATLETTAFSSFQRSFVSLRLGTGQQISTKMAAEVATQLTVGLFGPIYAQIDPMRLGEQARAMAITEDYCKRLKHSSIENESIQRLVSGYNSHSFVIDREEASGILPNVRAPNATEIDLFKVIGEMSEDLYGNRDPYVTYLNPAAQAPEAPSQDVPRTAAQTPGAQGQRGVPAASGASGSGVEPSGATDPAVVAILAEAERAQGGS